MIIVRAFGANGALLRVDRAYQPGDRIEIEPDQKHLIV